MIPRLALVLSAVAATSCAQGPGPARREPRAIVERFIALDTAGHGDSALALIWKERCDVLPSSDFDAPVSSARIVNDATIADTVLVSVEYRQLGRLTSHSRSRAGERGSWNYVFTPQARTDTVVFQVVLDSARAFRLDCGPYAANHPGVSRVTQLLVQMDDSSRARWEALAQQARSRD